MWDLNLRQFERESCCHILKTWEQTNKHFYKLKIHCYTDNRRSGYRIMVVDASISKRFDIWMSKCPDIKACLHYALISGHSITGNSISGHVIWYPDFRFPESGYWVTTVLPLPHRRDIHLKYFTSRKQFYWIDSPICPTSKFLCLNLKIYFLFFSSSYLSYIHLMNDGTRTRNF